jgi:hypothetical protein
MIMTRTRALAGVAALVGALSGCEDKGAGDAPTGATATAIATATATASATTSATAAAAATATASTTTSTSAGTGSAAAKKYDCGAKDQKPCPMQGWMKRVMAPASSSGDAAALTKALAYAAERPPPGFPDWTAMAKAGEAKAKSGDVDAAKASCKQCHDAYKETYKATMRDRPF